MAGPAGPLACAVRAGAKAMGVDPETWFGSTDDTGRPQRQAPHAPADTEQPERHWWAIAALFLPLVFCAIVGVGVFLMLHRQMGYFKPAPSGSGPPGHAWAACEDIAPERRIASA